MKSKIWLSSPHMSGAEQSYIAEAFDSNCIAPRGSNINAFEDDIAAYLKTNKHVSALTSGTAAIHIGLILLNVNQGDEVICQSNTFAASANPIVYLKATPIFVDSEKDTWNICPEQLELAIKDRIKKGKKPKAIVAVHLYGMPYKVDRIQAISKAYDIPVLEDSAEAFGSCYKHNKCGTFGELAVLSFNANKIITTSGGGALITNSKAMKLRSLFIATQAKDDSPAYLHSHIGYNYRISNVLAGIGRGQMTVLEDRVQKRRGIFEFYKDHLSAINELSFLEESEGFYSNRWLSCILTPSYEVREGLRLHLQSYNIETRPLWKPMHQQPIFKHAPSYTNGVSANLFEKGLCLPSGSNLTENELDRVSFAIKSYFEL